ncbi:esterase FE4-like [Zerene cesonia]|uniref:esterase FE4-like n=1 Tax=Zerene cesonia TaxID=33412 RepID=UPI0018E52C58|nr:esterase FE4-like [Zerene cesonia]
MLPLVVFLLFTAVQARLRLDPLVDTKQGLIKGLRADDGDYSMFLGIPYAVVDEDNPFGEAQPHPKFEEVFEAYDDSAICPQVEEFNHTIVGTLDCLHLNIYVPNKASSRNRLPVLVWIHGGGFEIGFAGRYLYGPKFLVRNDVILVTLNYRLGPYGFMCLDTPEVPGNQGLKDQVLALRWIKANIEEFGGDINKITVFGESAGAASVEYHLLSNSERLFNQAILQSGSVYAGWTMRDSDSSVPSKLAKQLGYETDSVDEALAFLKKTDVKLVIAAATEISLKFRPCVEKEFDGVESFITSHPVNVNQVAKAKNMAILSGYNDHEYLMAFVNQPEEFFAKNDPFDNLLPQNFNVDALGGRERLVRRFYIGDNAVSKQAKWDLINFQSDIYINHPVQRSVERFVNSNAKKVYHYIFSYNGGRNFVKKRMNITVGGAAHADELGYLFDMTILDRDVCESDQLIVDRVTEMWTNFVKHGNPTPEVSELIPVAWPAVTKDSLNYVDINTMVRLGARPFAHRLAFWDLFFDANMHAVKGYEN